MLKYTDLKDGDYVWVVYNINWDKDIPSQYIYAPTEYKLQKCLIIENNINVARQREIGDRYDSYTVTDYENWISINFNGLTYSRYYTDHYNDYKHMPMSAGYSDHGPWIEVFSDYEYAKEYLIDKCNNEISELKENIKKKQEEIDLLEKSLKQVE